MFRSHPMSYEEYIDLKSHAKFTAIYRFLDVLVTIHTNKYTNLSVFDTLYRHFKIESNDELKTKYLTHHEKRADYFVLSDFIPGKKNILFWQHDTFWEVLSSNNFPMIAENIIFDSICSRIESHILFHGACFSYEDLGIGICGISGTGKSTLSLELCRFGLQFLSDEIIALERTSRQFTCFPRLISVDRTSCDLVDPDKTWLEIVPRIDYTGESCIIDPLEFEKQTGIEHCDSSIIIFLEPQVQESDTHSNSNEHSIIEIASLFNHRRFIDYVRISIPEAELLKSEKSHDNTMHLRYRVPNSSRNEFRDLCIREKESIAYRVHRSTHHPDPSREPAIEKMDKQEALKKLLSFLRNRTTALYLEDKPNKEQAMGVVGEIFSKTMKLDYYQLSPGNLQKTASLVKSIVGT